MPWRSLMLKSHYATIPVLFAAVLAGAHGTALASPPTCEPQCPRAGCPCDAAVVGPCERAGPQSPRDIDKASGENPVRFVQATPATASRLCDVHFHKNAEHKARAYDTPADDGTAGFLCSEWARDPQAGEAAPPGEGCEGIELGDTIEVHWVYTTCNVESEPCIASCFSPSCANPQLRVEAQVFFLTNGDFGYEPYRSGNSEMVWTGPDDWAQAGYAESPPPADGAVEYLGSTTGSAYNQENACSPFQVTWNVRRDCRPLGLEELDAWCKTNVFCEDHAHGSRKLVTVPGLLSEIP
jgi:hypothetical protein